MALNVQMKSHHTDSFNQSRADRGRGAYDNGMVLVEPASHTAFAEKHQRWEMLPEKGNGWAEGMQISRGIRVGLCEYLLNNQEGTNCPALDHDVALVFGVMGSGTFNINYPDSRRTDQVGGGGGWVKQGDVDGFTLSQPAGQIVRSVKLSLPHSMVEAWLGETSGSLSGSLEKMICGQIGSWVGSGWSGSPFKSVDCGASGINNIVARMFVTPRDTVCGVLTFESLALDLLSRLLSLDCAQCERESKRSRCRRAVDDAVDILRQEWTTPPTIAALARRVGINECYLKKEFRERTGRTIGEYVRELRMGMALELLESGSYSVSEAAYSVGYSNPSQFSAAFKAFHGDLPSSCFAERK